MQIDQLEHPFLLVKKDEYADLRARMNYSPWKELGASAITTAKTSNITTTGSYLARCYYQRQLVGACSLAFILDPDNKSFYLDKLISLISQWDEDTNTIFMMSFIPNRTAGPMQFRRRGLMSLIYWPLTLYMKAYLPNRSEISWKMLWLRLPSTTMTCRKVMLSA